MASTEEPGGAEDAEERARRRSEMKEAVEILGSSYPTEVWKQVALADDAHQDDANGPIG